MSKLETLIKNQSELGFLYALISLVEKRLGAVRILLFGSRARFDFHRRSDVDILIESDVYNENEWVRLKTELEDLPTLLSIDLVRADQVEEDFLKHVRREGIVIHE